MLKLLVFKIIFCKKMLVNSASKIPSLQNEYSVLAKNLQAYSILKVMKYCKISALQSQSSARYEFFKFSKFFASFLEHLLNFATPSSKFSKKNIQKYIFDVKFPNLSNTASRIGLSIDKKPENRENLSIFKKTHSAKTPF